MRRHHKRGTARFGCLRRFCLSTHSESFGVIRWPECDCVCAGVGLSGGRGRLLTHVHRASACTLNAVGLLPVSGRGDARVAPPLAPPLCVCGEIYLTLPYPPAMCRRNRGHAILCSQGKRGRGAVPLVYTGVVLSLVSEGGKKIRISNFSSGRSPAQPPLVFVPSVEKSLEYFEKTLILASWGKQPSASLL